MSLIQFNTSLAASLILSGEKLHWNHAKRRNFCETALIYNGGGSGGRGGWVAWHLPHETQGLGAYPPRLVTMTHNAVEPQVPLLHHSMQHDQAGKTLFLSPDIRHDICRAN